MSWNQAPPQSTIDDLERQIGQVVAKKNYVLAGELQQKVEDPIELKARKLLKRKKHLQATLMACVVWSFELNEAVYGNGGCLYAVLFCASTVAMMAYRRHPTPVHRPAARAPRTWERPRWASPSTSRTPGSSSSRCTPRSRRRSERRILRRSA